ncbi:trypsin beta-like isoform X1 [Maniola jurtina]|uniref:trypsin beta-like isoform X1 n=2 Tax=Maniola jurtina TaxID=191418 RepID=UPI001E687A9B|nr:trypsin beta-like isoform X1 [Maniola jurtina]
MCKIFLLLCISKYLTDVVWSNPIEESSNASLFDVTGYPLTGDIPLLNRKIFRGTRVNVREHPYVVSIRRNGGHYVTGTLITKNLVLTVAHPIEDVPIQELRVVTGESYSDRGTSLLSVIIILIHQDFDPFTLVADICILRFFEDIIYRSSVKSISLVMPQMTLSGTAFVTGWGRCDFTGNELCLPRTSQYYPDEKIDPMLRSVPLTINSQNHYCEGYKLHGTDIGKGMLCAGGAREENSAYPCLAVPGAPLVLGAKLVGILSWGFGCGFQHDLPLIYTSTQYYTSWITHNIVMFRTLSNNDFTQLFQATKSCVLLDWLSRTRISMPLSHDHSNVYKELQLMKFDEKLVMLQGRPYDIRDYIYETEFHNKKILLYEEVKKTLEEKLSKAEIIKNASKLLLLHKVMPFLSNKSLLGVTYEDNDNSDDD